MPIVPLAHFEEVTTFALGVATPDVLKKWSDVTGGVKGISLPPVTSPTPSLSDDQFKRSVEGRKH